MPAWAGTTAKTGLQWQVETMVKSAKDCERLGGVISWKPGHSSNSEITEAERESIGWS